MRKVALYCRVSTAKQSCESQLVELREVAIRSGWEIDREYIDGGISGSIAQRPALDQLRRDAARRRFDLIVCWDISRLGRSLSNLVEIMEEMRALKVDFYFFQQSMDTTTPAGKLCFQIFASLAEWEREMIRERVRAGLENARRKGKKLGRPSRMNESLKTAILLLREKGSGIKEIARQLQVGIGTIYKALEAAEPNRQGT
jgi:DNA invertase Pin-like site-specific DNA recombinase